jgi:ribonuclease VapC
MAAVGMELAPLDADQAQIARQAFRQFGKGRHPAALNLGDCFSYALAKASGFPLLFKGKDFKKTDIQTALV